MAVELGKNLLTLLTGTGVRKSGSINPYARVQTPTAYKTSGYASIPYERAPQVTDTVPTKDAAGNPLLAGYVTPSKAWVF